MNDHRKCCIRMLCCLLLIAPALTACGHKGKLKTPAQIEHEAAKKQNQTADSMEQKAD